ncbi:MAG: hypothetical protein GY737_03765 [Desulfobacteraceae bacterium]|nr:hypothetical protein [Desulfobacteraceae bacterium]
MQLDQSPFYRTVITPWYDSNLACYILVFFLSLVLLIAGVGIWVAVTRIEYAAFFWFPVMLAAMSAFVMGKICFRVVNRNRNS